MALKSPVMNVMEAAARKASRGLIRDFGEVEHLQVSRKGPSDFVTAADLRVEKLLREELSKARPAFGLVMEESGGRIGAEHENLWIVDPIDGTTNFIHGIPHFAISIAHWRAGEIVSGLIYQPIGDEMFWADKGMGAYHNSRRLRVSTRQHLGDALIATGLPFKGKPKHPRYMETLAAVTPEVAGIRRFGSAALDLAWVAAGRFDGYWERDLNAWDLAAGTLLVTEAGGKVTDAEGGDEVLTSGSIVAGNLELHPQLLGRLTAAK
ncbi:MAG: inositol monophosphatase [Rhodospirillaceae bacterium]|nr:inositol monophosphatase [Rhodospirillaceae bacterium]